MLEGLVQHDHPLTLQHVLNRMRTVHRESQIVTLTDEGTERATYAEVCARVDKLEDRPDNLKAGMAGYLLPFEIVSVHLLVVLIGAAYLARPKKRADAGIPSPIR